MERGKSQEETILPPRQKFIEQQSQLVCKLMAQVFNTLRGKHSVFYKHMILLIFVVKNYISPNRQMLVFQLL